MRRTRRAAVLTAAAVTLSPLAASAAVPSGAGSVDVVPAVAAAFPAVPVGERLQPFLAEQLAEGGSDPLRVMVSGTSTQAALDAVAAAGLTRQQTWESVGVVVAVGHRDAVRAVLGQPGVTYVEGDAPLQANLSSAHAATRSDQALAAFTGPGGARVDGTGVSIAVIDSGIDGTHPMFQRGGRSTVVNNLENVCTFLTGPQETCFQRSPVNDTDTPHAGGHGTHVAGIAGGVEVTTTTGTKLRGAAPGASLVGFGLGGGLLVVNANAAMDWVVQHQHNPCKPASQQTGPADPACPPIKVTNHSYGPTAASGGNRFDPNSATVRLQRALLAKGVVPVWAAGNDGGNGSQANTNPPGMDPTGGVLMVGSYNDAGTGTRTGSMSTFSSRGNANDVTTFPDVSAPGDRITSACRPYLAVCSTGLQPLNGPSATDIGTFNTISGTSMAAPYVAGVVAQLFQADPTLTPADVELVLEGTALKFRGGTSSPGPYVADDPARNATSKTSFDKGHGLVDVYAALSAVLGDPATTAAAPASTGGRPVGARAGGAGKR